MFVCGLATLGAISSIQSMFFILPSVSCEMGLSSIETAFLGSATFIGSLSSSNFFGFLVDQYGRRKIILITTFGVSFSTFLASLAPGPITLMLFTLATGVMLGGVFGLPYVYLSEFCSKKIRAKYLTLAALIAVLANTYSPSIAWIVMWLDLQIPIYGSYSFTSWRLYLIINVLPTFFSALMLVQLPESPKFLLYLNKSSEAQQVLASCYAANKRCAMKEFPISSLRLDAEDEEQQMSKKEQNGFLDFFITLLRQMKEMFTPPFVKYTCICCLLMVAVFGLYGVVLLWIPQETMMILHHMESDSEEHLTLCDIMSSMNDLENQGGCYVANELFFISTVTGVAFFVLNIFIVFLVLKFQVIYILGGNVLLASVMAFLIAFSEYPASMLVLLGGTVAVLGASQSLVYNIIVDFFPTSLRATASSIAMFFGRVTVPIGSSLVGAAFKNHCTMAYILLASAFAVIGLICIFTPLKRKTFNTRL